ncbi:GTPase IMAP family member 8 [Sorex fumeus]|uniref:GTPase IMAP family member 8 n=1 Tax=Sorex fumeus TaxID=62283 RepID=UPI0024ADB479|nr:GTPase IMAP family member 8 [Sorex fumeus]
MEMPKVPGGPKAAKGRAAAPRSSRSAQEPGLRLLLLGKRGAGKSATGNSILDRSAFVFRLSAQAVTKECQSARGTVQGMELVVIDTPDLFSSSISAETQRGHLERCVELSAPGPHALLLVIPIGHFTREDEETIYRAKSRFGPEIMRYSIVVFTRKDELGNDSLHELMESSEALKALVRDCGGRYCAFDNKASGKDRDEQVSELLCKIKHLVDQNGEQPYCLNLGNEHSELQMRTHAHVFKYHYDAGASGTTEAQDSMNERSDSSYGSEEMQVQSTSSDLAPETEDSELRVLLVGKHGAGKSTIGNCLLGKQVFDTGFSEKPVTMSFQSESRDWKKRKLLIIDTPDISSPESFQRKFQRCTYGDPHVFLMVIPIGSFSKEDKALLKSMQRCFGRKVFGHMFILLTREEDRRQNTETLKDRDDSLNSLLKKCKNKKFSRYKEMGEGEQKQVDQLLQELVSLTEQNANKPCAMEDTLNIILVGRGGTGKSATGNTIIGREVFPSQLSAQPVTKTCWSQKKKWGRQDVVVVDTPSLLLIPSDSERSSQPEEEIQLCSRYCEGNKILFVLVFQLGRFTQMDQNVLVQLEAIFGQNVKEYTIVLFTRKEDLGGDSIEDYIENVDCNALKEIVKECGRRVCAFNNRESGQAKETQVRDLLKMANDVIENHGGCGYTFNLEKRIKHMESAQGKSKYKSQKQDSRNCKEFVSNAYQGVKELALRKLQSKSTEHFQK